eukprot:Clim_evm37s239 gene=Clim_evmTU37s239
MEDTTNWFEEPEGFRPPTPPPTSLIIQRERGHNSEGQEDHGPAAWEITLVGHHSLWAHCLWNGGRFIGGLIDKQKVNVKSKHILEFGAAGALPTLSAACNGAALAVATDYPDKELIEMIESNVAVNLTRDHAEIARRVKVLPFKWGGDEQPLLALTPDGHGYDIIVCADIMATFDQHENLVRNCWQCLRRDDPRAMVLVYFSHHRPWLKEKDLQFFEHARNQGFQVEEIETVDVGPMFEEDRGDRDVRKMLHGYRMTVPRKEP